MIDYTEQRRLLNEALGKLLDAGSEKYKKCLKAAFAANPDWPDFLSDSPTVEPWEGLGVLLILAYPETPANKKLQTALRACQKDANPPNPAADLIRTQLDDLERKAIDSEQRAGRLVLSDKALRERATELQYVEWPPSHSASVPSKSKTIQRLFADPDDFASIVAVDRFVNELLLLMRTKGSQARLGPKLFTLSQIASKYKTETKLHVDDHIYLGATGWTPDPAGEDALRQLFGAGALSVFDINDVEAQELTEVCYAPMATAGGYWAEPLGLVAHAFVAWDYEKTMKADRRENLHVDDQKRGPKNPKMVDFLLTNNPQLAPSDVRLIKKGGYGRPDLILHRHNPLDTEFEETKPDSKSGIARGIRDVKDYADWMTDRGLPYVAGSGYQPTGRFPIHEIILDPPGVPVYIDLKIRRGQAGLILYQYCFKTDFDALRDWIKKMVAKGVRVILKNVLVKILLTLLEYLLRSIPGSPGSPGSPPPRLPDRIPVPVIPVPAPQPVLAMATNVSPSIDLIQVLQSLGNDEREELESLLVIERL